MLKQKTIYSVFFALCSFFAQAQNEMEINTAFDFSDFCFDKNIHTVLAYKTGNELSAPYIEIASGQTLTFSFDDFECGNRRLYYTITHCDADWHEDNLFIGDYMRGFNENYLDDYSMSVNTNVTYAHYTFTIPNADVSIIASGNYLLKVYDSGSLQQPLFQKGFMIAEKKAALSVECFKTGIEGTQRLAFSVGGVATQNAATEIKVRVEQNSQRVPSVQQPLISFQNGATIEFADPYKNVYPAGNEFRAFDIRTLAYNARGVAKILKQTDDINVILNPDMPQKSEFYEYNRDINGNFFVDVTDKNITDKNIESDYVYVFFTLPSDAPVEGEKIYVFGALSNWSFAPECAMEYNYARRAYEVAMPLKQGFYNYKYVGIDKNGKFISDFFNQNFSETENIYTIYVYQKGLRDRYDRLIGTASVNTMQ